MATELLKVEFQITVLDRADDGSALGERVIAQGAVHAARLDEFPDAVREAVASACPDKVGESSDE